LPGAILEVSHDKSTIILNDDGLRLPLASYGTGVHELVILVTAVLSIENAICCIEEPEIHLHPRLQRELIDFITTETTNQYLISTHSPTFINAIDKPDDVQVFHLRLENGATVGAPILKDEHGLRALHDLGVKASDILQSNCVVWVEGPSDRIYLNRWLELVAPDLLEGQHYSIMFYGGRLLSHLYLDRVKVPDELIHILRINQHSIVMMDSDRKKSGARLNQTKLRVREECERSGGVCWVTDGREVENYLPERVVVAACEDLVGKQIQISIEKHDKFEDVLSRALKAAQARKINYSADKVKYAREFVQHFGQADIQGPLEKRVKEVVEKIRSWNE
jgi:predicted ATP-dependent endonuclease of OLD family